MIADSGERREFPTGAVRDIQANKGEPTLMPLKVVAKLLEVRTGDYIIKAIANFLETNDTKHLYAALLSFSHLAYRGCVETMILETSIHYQEGCEKYGRDNWKKGLPVNCYMNSAIRHYLKYRRKDNDESHDRAFVWNLMCCIWEVNYHENKTSEN